MTAIVALLLGVALVVINPSESATNYGNIVTGVENVAKWRDSTQRFEAWLTERGFARAKDTSITFRSGGGEWEMTRRSGSFAGSSGGTSERTLESATLYTGELDAVGPARFSLVIGSRPPAEGEVDPAFLWLNYGISGSKSHQAGWDAAESMLKALVYEGTFTPPAK